MTVELKPNKDISFIVNVTKGSASKKRKVTFKKLLADKMLIISVIKDGVPYSLFEQIRKLTPFDDEDWAEILEVSTKSLQRYKQSSKQFNRHHSQRIIEMAEVAVLGRDVFGDSKKFELWLDTPNFALGKLKPIELLRNSYGKDLVLTELVHINHGIFV